ncbi:MAG TPA: ERCC4 domain-containing protein [Gaiellaceae bacterium]|nr:ERCC4 domain-containing protein [Gaiellaceae bacterium]
MDGGLSPSPVIVADVFEEGSGVPVSLQRLGAQVVVEPLSAGDYRISGGALVERKTVADLHGSLGRGRLWSQIGRVRDAAALPFLFVEGADIDDGPRHPNAIRGCLLAIADLGVAVVRSRDPADTAQWLHRLAVRQQRRQRASTPTPRRRVLPAGLSVLAGVPGISDTTARALLERFGSVQRLLAAGPAEWAEVNGVGPVRAHALAEALLDHGKVGERAA